MKDQLTDNRGGIAVKSGVGKYMNYINIIIIVVIISCGIPPGAFVGV
jgi:hypothetical protein